MATMRIWGVVNSDGTVNSGGGFSINHQGDGEYIISFSTAFSGIPAIVGNQVLFGRPNQNPLDGLVFPFLDSGSATVLTSNANGAKVDRSFAFIAIGSMDE
ncbi:MAG: hypothetical protein QNJ55_30795 [Xenococcus sp. MO_188.B8]|nr:hypothetical protein [Xenococcus sp. MO_188.B8]